MCIICKPMLCYALEGESVLGVRLQMMSSFSHVRNLEPEISCLGDWWCVHRVIWAPGVSFIWSSCFLELATQVWNLDKAVSGVYMYIIVRRRVK